MTTTSQPPATPEPVQQKLLAKAAHTELVAVNFQVPPALLTRQVPKGLELDYYNDETYVSLVCMVMGRIGFMGINAPYLRIPDFPEKP